jgi:hypothetical protein
MAEVRRASARRWAMLHVYRQFWVASPAAAFCDLSIALFALSTLTWNLAYFFGASLQLAIILGMIALVLAPFLLAWRLPADTEATANEALTRSENWWLLGFIALAIAITLFVHRPDADDAAYLAIAVSLLDSPTLPIYETSMLELGSGGGRYAISVLNPLAAGLSYLTAIPLLYWYYVLLPSLFAALTIIVHARLLRMLIGEGWILGVFFVLVIMVAWGDIHRTPANFGLVRLFQGKAVLVSFIVPAILFYFLKLARDQGTGYFALMLAFASVGAVGATPNGLAIAPLMLFALWVAAAGSTGLLKHIKAISLFALALAPIGFFMWYHYADTGRGIHVGGGRHDAVYVTNLDMYRLTMGSHFRGMVMFAAAMLSFFFVRDSRLRAVLRGYIAIFLVLMAIPWTSMYLALTFFSTLSWRWLWMMPFSALAAVAVAGGAQQLRSRIGLGWSSLLVLAFLVWFVSVSPRRVVSHENNAEVRPQLFKLEGNRVHLTPVYGDAEIVRGRIYIEGKVRGF